MDIKPEWICKYIFQLYLYDKLNCANIAVWDSRHNSQWTEQKGDT